eukprot:CAMPEP_0113559870 /NCGR_PEP_ID=MMETSP0015_2-20120614/19128_1 /TAXON_ID=2838 /ORGANISM="Odontella" /LENGTH=318 /DNA_ID=CAMNT_0000461537 /DNA_START=125 /DNA_END=1081 /DNA_ORIENTATION=+ /assembly_acc=CAM_ASM_000160
MTTDFDKQGFSAVAAFFGKEGESSGDKPRSRRDEETTRAFPQGRGNRLGLGASSSSKSRDGLAEDLDARKQLLGVGRKKRGRGQHDDDDASGSYAEDGGDSDDDEEEGRTVAVKQPKVKEVVDPAICEARKKKKRKKKKKKDLQEQPQGDDTVANRAAQRKESGGILPQKTNDANAQKEDRAATEKRGDGEGADISLKRARNKRRKVRSRQKNIRKDNRTDAEKPSHLVPGRDQYAGRSLTQETRKRLNLPESKTRSRHVQMARGNIDSNGMTADRASGGESYDLGLAIDEYLDIGDAASAAGKETIESKRHEREQKS